jgi:hypothetical protein
MGSIPEVPKLHMASDIHLEFNTSLSTLGEDEGLFRKCWRHQSCDACLSTQDPCSWCDISQVCVANTRAPYPFQILAPIGHADICPLAWRKRWEMRAKPFSCRCSTMTLMSVTVAVMSTLVALLLIFVSVRIGKWSTRRWKGGEEQWWKVKPRRPRWTQWGTRTDEERPLLHQQ